MTKKIQFLFRANLVIDARTEREAFAIIAEHFDRVASVKDRNQIGNPFAEGKWEIQIKFTAALKKELREAFTAAVAAKKQEFEWRGTTLVVDYAKYLLEYLDGFIKED